MYEKIITYKNGKTNDKVEYYKQVFKNACSKSSNILMDHAAGFSLESTRTENEKVRSKTSLDFWTKMYESTNIAYLRNHLVHLLNIILLVFLYLASISLKYSLITNLSWSFCMKCGSFQVTQGQEKVS